MQLELDKEELQDLANIVRQMRELDNMHSASSDIIVSPLDLDYWANVIEETVLLKNKSKEEEEEEKTK